MLPAVTTRWHHLFALVALLVAAASCAAEQDSEYEQRLLTRWPALDTSLLKKPARFFYDPNLLRRTASPEIEASIRKAYATVLDLQKTSDALAVALKQGKDTQVAQKSLDSAIGLLANARSEHEAALAQRATWLAQNHGYRGALLQRDLIIVRFRYGTPVETISHILDTNKLHVDSGISRIALFFTTPLTGTKGDDRAFADRLNAIIDVLKGNHEVLDAYPNTILQPTVVPGPSDLAAPTNGNPSWNWFDGSPGTMAAIVLKLPTAWNFNDAIRALNTPPRVVVMDEAFAPHKDLRATQICEAPISSDGHGNHVAGIIGATFDNGIGVDRGSPLIELFTCAPGTLSDSDDDALPSDSKARAIVFTALAQKLREIASGQTFAAFPNPSPPRLVNISLGYKWQEDLGLLAEEWSGIQRIVTGQGSTMRALLRAYPDVLVVSAAGNDTPAAPNSSDSCLHPPCVSDARWTSPVNYAALGDVGSDDLPRSANVLVVESRYSDQPDTPAASSSTGGTIAAPGTAIASTVDHDDRYDYKSGTSMAAAEISSLVTLMLAYNAGLTVKGIRDILVTSPPSVPNAFLALVRSQPSRFARDLADLGLADLKPNGIVDMADFNAFADCLVDYANGMATGVFTIDQNGDGKIDANDAKFSRCDFNGDGKVTLHDPAPVPNGSGGQQMLTDLEVMLLQWGGPKVDQHDLEQQLEKKLHPQPQ
jgi:hypothetical protein